MSDLDGQDEMFPGAPVSNLGESDVVASLSAFARAFGTDRETLRRRLLAGNVEPAAERSGHKIYRLREVFAAWSQAPEGGVDPESLSPFNRRAWYQGELDKLRLEEGRRELIPRIEVEQAMASLVKGLIEGLESLPDTVERDCGGTPSQLVRIEEAVDKIREEMYRRLLESSGEDMPAPEAAPAKEPAPKQRQRVEAALASSSTLDAAGLFLREMLEAGPRLAAELIAAAVAKSISETSLRRAKSKLGVVAKRSGKAWAWELPEGDQGSQAG